MRRPFKHIATPLLLLVIAVPAFSQHKYKVQYLTEVEHSTGSTSSDYSYGVNLANFRTDQSGPSLMSGTVRRGPIETSSRSADRIISTSTTYDRINRRVTRRGSSFFTDFDFCEIETGQNSNLLPSNVWVSYFVVFRIETLAVLNNYNVATNTIPDCESRTIVVARNPCARFSYAVQYQIGNGTWRSLLGYNSKNGSFQIGRSTFPGLQLNQNVRIRVQYNNSGQIHYSDVLTYSFIPCSPNLIGAPTVRNATCAGGSNGGFSVRFDRSLVAGEQLRMTLSGVTPEGFTIPEQNRNTTQLEGGNRYTWPNNLQAGNYSLSYQTFVNNNPADVRQTSFTVREPSAVTVGVSSVVQPLCSDDFGSVTLVAAGGRDLVSGTYQYIRNGSSWQNSPTFSGLSQGQLYTFRSRVVLSGGGICESAGNVQVRVNNISDPLRINSTQVRTRPSYPGAGDGSIRVVLNNRGGTGPFTYQARRGSVAGSADASITTSSRIATLSGLAPRTYVIVVLDANNCRDVWSSPIELTPVPLPVLGSVQSNAISCFNGSDGVIDVSVSGGEVPYTYEWRRNGSVYQSARTTSGSSIRLSNLSSGNYELRVSSAGAPLHVSAARSSVSVNLANPSQVGITQAVGRDLSCPGSGDGRIDVSATGGTRPYSYRLGTTGSWTTVGGLASSWSIGVADPGLYRLFVRDENNCTVEFGGFVEVAEPQPILLSEVLGSHVDNVVNGGSSGVLEVSINNEVDPTTYRWTRNGQPFTPPSGSTNTRLVNLPAGSYGLSVTDSNGCSGSLVSAIIITEPDPVVITGVVSTPLTCAGSGDGNIAVSVTGGVAPYSYRLGTAGSWVAVGGNASSWNIPIATGGLYRLFVRDVHGFTVEHHAMVEVAEPPAIVINEIGSSRVNNTVFGGTSGELEVEVLNGVLPLGYVWTRNGLPFVPPAGSTGERLVGLSAGLYGLTVSDVNGCVGRLAGAIEITEPELLEILSVSAVDMTCFGSGDGALEVEVSGGIGPYSYRLNGGSWVAVGLGVSSWTIDIGVVGSYELSIRDASDVVGAYPSLITISEPVAMTVEELLAEHVDNIVFGGMAGVLEVEVSDDTPPNVYAWTRNGDAFVPSGPGGARLTGLGAGAYSVSVTDSRGCVGRLSTPVVITEPDPLQFSSVSATDITCQGSADGQIEVQVTGGILPYSYRLGVAGPWREVGGNASSWVIPIASGGAYDLTVRDVNFIEVTYGEAIEVLEPSAIVIEENEGSRIDNVVFGGSQGELEIIVSHQVDPSTFSWTRNGEAFAPPVGSTDTYLRNLPAGSYLVSVEDSNGCVGSLFSAITITEPDELRITNVEVEDITCFGAADGRMNVTVEGGIRPYRYRLNEGDSWVDVGADVDSWEIVIGQPGVFALSVEDAAGVVRTLGSTVEVMEPLAVLVSEVLSSHVDNIVFGGDAGTLEISVENNVGVTTYGWTRDGVDFTPSALSSSTRLVDLEAGSYEVLVRDGNGCEATLNDPIVITEPDPLVINLIAPTDISCFGAADGTIRVSTTGGIAPYSYRLGEDGPWINVGGEVSEWDIPVSSGGEYRVFVRDVNGIEVEHGSLIQVGEPLEIMVAELLSAHIDNDVFGGTTGQLEVTVLNDELPSVYAWTRNGEAFDPPAGSTDTRLVNLPWGLYDVEVTDAGGCTARLASPIVISEPSRLLITDVGVGDVSCFGADDGSIAVTVSGGVLPYSYQLNGGPWVPFSSNELSATFYAPVGVHELTVRDASLLEVTYPDELVITEPPAIEVEELVSSHVDNIVFEGASGVLEINVRNVRAPASYVWTKDGMSFTPSVGSTDTRLVDLEAGGYLVTVTDAAGCVGGLSSPIIVTAPDPLLITRAEPSAVSCHGAADGSLEVEASGGILPYSYRLGSTGPWEPVTGSSWEIPIDRGGSYDLFVRDVNGFTAELSAILVAEPPAIRVEEVVASRVDNTVFGGSDGVLEITLFDHEDPVNYTWTRDGSPFVPSDPGATVLESLSAGRYEVVVTDARGCTGRLAAPITITQPERLLITSAVPTDISCHGAGDGLLTIELSGGIPSYSYRLNDEEWVSLPMGATEVDIPIAEAGAYALTVRDAAGVEVGFPASLSIGEPALIEVFEVPGTRRDNTVFGGSDGWLEVLVLEGAAPLTFHWSMEGSPFTSVEGPRRSQLADLAAGAYTLTVTDNNGCTGSLLAPIVIDEPDRLVVTDSTTTAVSCHGFSDGTIDIEVQGGIAPYGYEWLHGPRTEDLAGIGAGTYRVSITDSAGVTVEATATVLEPMPLLLTHEQEDNDCFGELEGRIEIDITGGTAPYSISWAEVTTPLGPEGAEVLEGLGAGAYEVTVQDARGCEVMETITIVDEHPPLVIEEEVREVSSFAGSDGRIEVDVLGGRAPYDLSWRRLSDGADLGNSTVLSDLEADEYELTVMDANGCQLSRLIAVSEPDIIEVLAVDPECAGGCNGSLSIEVNRGTGSFSSVWATGETTSVLEGLCAGTYTVTILEGDDEVAIRSYTLEDPEQVPLDLGGDRVLCLDQTALLGDPVGDPGMTYEWFWGDERVATASSIEVGEGGEYRLTTRDAQGCEQSDTVVVETLGEELVAEFAVSSQVFVGDTVVMIDISHPEVDSSAWIFPEGLEVLAQDDGEVIMVFSEEGDYEVLLEAHRGGCSAVQSKTILVTEKLVDPEAGMNREPRVEEVRLYPNPSQGEFTVEVILSEAGAVNANIYNITGNRSVASDARQGELHYEMAFDLTEHPRGPYAVVLETSFGSVVRKIILQ